MITCYKCPIHFRYKDHSAFCFLTFSFSIVYYSKQGLDTFDDGYVDGIYLLKLHKLHICGKKVQAFANMYWVCI